MKKQWSLVVGALLVAGNAWAQEESKVTLVAQKAVYKVGSGSPLAGLTEGVTVTLFNGSSQTVFLSNADPVSVTKKGVSVWEPYAILILKPVAAGTSASFTWGKIDANTNWVKPGTYTITVGPLWLDNKQFSRSVNVALTSTGKLDGTRRFPLSVGNEWQYASATSAEAMKVTGKKGTWFKVKNLLDQDRWAKLTGYSTPVLSLETPSGEISSLFRFNYYKGAKYSVNVPPIQKLVVGATNAMVTTPAGAFAGCHRFDVFSATAWVGTFGSFWFAPGIGLVQYTRTPASGGSRTYKLRAAKIKGSDGATYIIGQK